MAAQKSSSKMINITSFTAVRTKDESVETALLAEDVQRSHVGEQVIDPVAVRRVLQRVPLLGQRELAIDAAFSLALIVHGIETNHTLQENVQLGVRLRVSGDFEQGLEEVDDDLLEVIHQVR